MVLEKGLNLSEFKTIVPVLVIVWTCLIKSRRDIIFLFLYIEFCVLFLKHFYMAKSYSRLGSVGPIHYFS